MCEQCCAGAEMVVVNVVPGFHLMRATTGSDHWNKDWYGLVETNDPTAVFAGPLHVDPTFGWTDDAINSMSPEVEAQQQLYDQAVDRLEDALIFDPRTGYRLVSACMKEGYDPENGGSLHYWLMHHIAAKAASQTAGTPQT
jgi:hypothetical protein